MADQQDQGDKTEEPTQHRLNKARQDGDVAKSVDLSGATLLFGMMLLLFALGMPLYEGLIESTKQLFGVMLAAPTVDGDAGAATLVIVRHAGPAILGLAAGALVLSVIAHVAQTGLMFTAKKLEPKIDKLNPVEGFKNLFLKADTYVKFLMGVAKITAVAAVAIVSFQMAETDIIGLNALDHRQTMGEGGWIIFLIGIKVAAALFILGIVDFAYQKQKKHKELRMSHDDIKKETREQEGDPHMNARRKQIAAQRAMQRAQQTVPGADFVVTNPTHFAVALKYDAALANAPVVVAKGADHVAFRIRELAAEHAVPVIEKPPLARALWRSAEVGDEIPEEHFAAVAEILAYVYQMDGLAATGRGDKKTA
jgi:flagellar biosynthetic protein FlhB